MTHRIRKSLSFACPPSTPAVLLPSLTSVTLLTCLLMSQTPLVQAGVAGRIQFVVGDVRIVGADGRERAAQKGGEVGELESILTGNGAQAQIKMIDGGLLALRPDTQLQLDAYVFDHRNAQAERAWFTLLKGGLRSLTGLIGTHNKERYAIRTPNAVISVRGTDHEPVVILPNTVISQTNPPGTYDKVNVGTTSLTNQAGTTLIQRNQIGFASAQNAAPTLLNKLPDFYQTSPQVTPQAANTSSEEQARKDTLTANQVRESSELDSLGDSLDAGNLTLAPPAQQLKVRQLNGVKPDGTLLDTNSQILIGANGDLSTVDVISLTPNSPITPIAPVTQTPDMVVGFSANQTSLSSYLAQAKIVATNLSQQVDGLRNSETNSTAKQSLAVATMDNASQKTALALTSANNASTNANSNGNPLDSKVITPSFHALAAANDAITLSRLAIQGEGVKQNLANLQNFSAALTQEYERYANNLNNWQKSNNAEHRLALQLDDAVLTARSAQLSQIGNIDFNKSYAVLEQAKLSAENAYTTAMLAQAVLDKLPRNDPNYRSYEILAQDSLKSANLAKMSVTAAKDALDAAQLSLQKLNDMANNTPRNIGVEQLTPAAQSLSKTHQTTQLTNLYGTNGNLLSTQTIENGAFGPIYRSLYYISGQSPTFADTSNHAATGLAWGRWVGGQIAIDEQYTGRDSTGKIGLGAIDQQTGQFVIGHIHRTSTEQGPASLHWITGINAEPKRLAQSLTGTAHYTMVGGTRPTDNFGAIGTLNSASLNANFSTQSVSAMIDMTFGNQQWVLGGQHIPLVGNSFAAQYCPNCVSSQHYGLSILTKNGVPIAATTQDASKLSPTASISGNLMGVGLASAGLQYAVTDPKLVTIIDPLSGLSYQVTSNQIMQGVVGFSGPMQNIKTPYRAVTASDGGDFVNAVLSRTGQASVSAAIGNGSPVNRLVDSAHGMEEFIGSVRNYTPVAGNTRDTKQEMAATIKRGTSVNSDVASAKFGNVTVNWGRWENGSLDVYSRDGSIKLGSVNNNGRSTHWLNTSASSDNLASLPLTGAANYKMVGGTAPTDINGNVGVVQGAKVDVDFSTLRAHTNLAVSFNSPTNTSTWNVEVRNTPFLRTDLGFTSSSNNHGNQGETHLVNCTGMSCGSVHSSAISAFFLGHGAGGLGFSYDLLSMDKMNNNNPSNNVTPSLSPRANAHGVVILRK